MKKLIGFLALACLPLLASAQYFQDFAGCPDAGVAVRQVTSLPFFGKSSDDRQSYFSEKLEPILQNQDPSGDIILTVIIGEDGAPCLSSYQLNGQVRIEPNHLKNIVDGMQGWQPARQEEVIVPYAATINLRFKGNKVVARLVK